MPALIRQQYGSDSCISPDLFRCLQFLEQALPLVRPVQIPLCPAQEPPHIVYTDASWEPHNGRIVAGLGGILFKAD
eukprot:9175229-Karenia_brevis.AAC.1